MGDVQNIFDFISLIHKFQQVKRRLLATGEDRYENDAEHSYQLAMVAWYIIELEKLPLDIGKVLKYALVHDLVEVYAGDTYVYEKDAKYKGNKKEREHEAFLKLKKEFPEFGGLSEYIEGYEDKVDPESKFVYTVDKLLPGTNIYLDNGKSWQLNKISLQMIIDDKTGKFEHSKEVKGYFEELLNLIAERRSELLPHDL